VFVSRIGSTWIAVAALAAANDAAAHSPDLAAGPIPPLGLWSVEPWVVCLLVLSGALYAVGVVRLWRHAGTGRGVQSRQAAAFAAGWLGGGGAGVLEAYPYERPIRDLLCLNAIAGTLATLEVDLGILAASDVERGVRSGRLSGRESR
jgi:hypothetical protein